MADGFEAMVDAGLAFFPKLAAHNSKDWFADHKDHYRDEIAKPAGFFADLMAEDIGRATGKGFKPKVFRIYRDVRFSKDKTPLNAHLHVMWQPVDGDALAPAWFWGLSPDYFIVGMGVMGLKGPDLARFRAFVDAWGDDLRGALDGVAAKGGGISDWGPEPLKRVPKPYDAEHPHADLLRRKALAVHMPMGGDWRDAGVIKTSMARVRDLMPVWDIFDAHL